MSVICRAMGFARTSSQPTHKIAALRSYVYSAPDMKSPPVACSVLNALVPACVERRQVPRSRWRRYIVARMRARWENMPPTPSTSARGFLGTPYFWGGRTSIGLDCSGSVQLACEAAGYALPATPTCSPRSWATRWIEPRVKLARGDLVFWDGHVGIMTSPAACYTPMRIIWPWRSNPSPRPRSASARRLGNHWRAAAAAYPAATPLTAAR